MTHIAVVLLTAPTRPVVKRHRYIDRAIRHFEAVNDISLIVVGDEDSRDSYVDYALNISSIESEYVVTGRTRNYYREQKTEGINEAIKIFSDDTVIYVTVHDHFWHPNLWNELRTVERVGILPLGNTSKDPGACERPIYLDDGTIYAWSAAYAGRRFPVNTGAWAIKRSILPDDPKIWWPSDKGNDSAFLAKIVPNRTHLQPLCDHCNYVYAWQSVKIGSSIADGNYPRLDLPRFTLIDKGDWK